MEIHLAGVPGGGTTGECKREKQLNLLWKYRLWSYYWLIKDKGIMPSNNKVELFLDSGAYSAWSQKKEIDIQSYISFIKENKSVISVYANLDAIGDAEKTYQNQRTMEKAGLKPLPVFHYGEDEKYLIKYLKGGYDYLALGGMVPISTPNLVQWLDHLYSKYICPANNGSLPIIKIHGFGLTSLYLMLRYPWYSVDSTSWVIVGRMGSVYVPRRRNGVWVYGEDSWKVVVSNRSPATKEAGAHMNTLSPLVRKEIFQYLEEKGYVMGKSRFVIESQDHKLQPNERWADKKPTDKKAKRELEIFEQDGICNRYQLRDELNIIYFLDLEKSLPKWPWAFRRQSQSSFF